MSNRPVITLRGPVRRQEGGGWEWTGIWAFGALPDDVEGETSVETPTPPQPVPIRRKKGKRKFILKGARPFRYHVSLNRMMLFGSRSNFSRYVPRRMFPTVDPIHAPFSTRSLFLLVSLPLFYESFAVLRSRGCF